VNWCWGQAFHSHGLPAHFPSSRLLRMIHCSLRVLPEKTMERYNGGSLKNCEDDRRGIYLHRGHAPLPFHRTASARGNLNFLPIYASWRFFIRVPRSDKGRTVQLLFHFFLLFLYSLIHGYFSQSDRSCHSRHIHRFLFPERVMANSARSLESLAMMTPNRVQNA